MHWADYLVFAAFLCISIGTGIYFAFSGGRQRTTEEFILGDRKMKVIPVVISLLVSYQSAMMILGLTAEMYTRGTMYLLWASIGCTLGIFLAERIVVPWMYPLKLTSIYEYFQRRFESKVCRMFAASLGILSSVSYLGVSMYAPSLALEITSDVSLYVSIPTMAGVCTIYTALGGIKAVVWTDVIQSGFMLGGMFTIMIKALMEAGGITEAFNLLDSEGRTFWTELTPDPTVRHSIWGFLIGWPMIWGYTYSLIQSSIQRYGTTSSITDARSTLLLNIPFILFISGLACLTGIGITAYYASIKCDILAAGRARHPNEILPRFVIEMFQGSPGFSGFFLATLFSGALSTISSLLSAAAAVTWEDIVKPKFGRRFTASGAAIFNRLLVVFYGLIGTGLAVLASVMPGHINQVGSALNGSIAGPLLGMFLLGGFIRRATWIPTVIGGLVGFLFNAFITMGSISVKRSDKLLPSMSTSGCTLQENITGSTVTAATFFMNSTDSFLLTHSAVEDNSVVGYKRLFLVSYLWYLPIGCSITMLVGLLLSLIPHFSEEKKIPEELFISGRSLLQWNTTNRSQSILRYDEIKGRKEEITSL